MASDPVGELARVRAEEASARSLSTARAVLRVLSLLGRHPAGVCADEVAAELGKSVSTAYYLLASLCAEGFAVHESKGVYRPARPGDAPPPSPEPPGDDLSAAVDALFARTRRRSYVAVVRDGQISIVAYRGRQGVPRIPGLRSEIRDSAHALALGKVMLAGLDETSLARFVAGGLARFTERTITSPTALAAELGRVREQGIAVDREEFGENFCCIAAPIRDPRGRLLAALGLSVTAPVFDAERERLTVAVAEVAASAGAQRGLRPPVSDSALARRALARVS